MKIGLRVALAIAIALIQWTLGAEMRADAQQREASRIAVSGAVAEAGGEVVRAIDDPSTGNYWLLERDPRHPAGPGRLVLAPAAAVGARPFRQSEAARKAGELQRPEAVVRMTQVIHAGDRLVVEENTPVVTARLEAVALGPAVAGAVFEVRLQIGGRAVRAVALGPGRAVFADQIGARR